MMPDASSGGAKDIVVVTYGQRRPKQTGARLFSFNYYLILIAFSLLASRYLADNGSSGSGKLGSAWQVLAQDTKGGPSSASASSSFSSSASSSNFEAAKGQPVVSSKFRDNILSVQRKQQVVQPVVQQKVVSQTVVDDSVQELITGQKVEQVRQEQQLQQQQQQQIEQQQVVSRVENSLQQQRESVVESQQQLQEQQQSEASAEPTIYGSIKGSPGIDFPAYTSIPNTKFSCDGAPFDPGMYADESTACQVYHMCYQGRRESFLCGVGTVFNQAIMSCDFWHSVECNKSSRYYNLNADFGKSSSEPPAGNSASAVSTTATGASISSTKGQAFISNVVRPAPAPQTAITNSFSTKSIGVQQQARQQQIIQASNKPIVPVVVQPARPPPPPPTVVSSSSVKGGGGSTRSFVISTTSSVASTKGGGGGGKTSVRNFDLQQQQVFNSQRTAGGVSFVSPSRRVAAQREEQLRRRLAASSSQFAAESSRMESIATTNTVDTIDTSTKSQSIGRSNRRPMDAATLNGLTLSAFNDIKKQPAAATKSGLSTGTSSSSNDQDQVWKPYFKSKTKAVSAKSALAPSRAQEQPTAKHHNKHGFASAAAAAHKCVR